nr:hypothetical protein [uncultured Flavobacterium sp.]
MLAYLKFWLKSSNQHGLHSPFVYNYLTKGLYEVEQISENKKFNWVFKTIKYFQPSKIYVESNLQSNFIDFKDLFVASKKDADLLFVQNLNINQIEHIIEEMGSKQLLFICNEKYDSSIQKRLRENDKITLVVDFFVGSLISKRTEQLKQNFFLRL